MNQTLDQMRATLETEIKTVDEALVSLRAQRDALNDQIRLKVTEQTELRSAFARLTPRTRRAKVEAPVETPEA